MRRYLPLLLLLILPYLLGAKACGGADCKQLTALLELAKQSGNPDAIAAAGWALAEAGCSIVVEPTPAPPTPPAPTPDPAHTTPTPTPAPAPAFPVRFPLESATLYMRNARYGNGIDSTIRVNGDPALGEALHHVPTSDYHFDSDVWRAGERADYEMLVLGGARDGRPLPTPLGAVWQYRSGPKSGRCHDDRSGNAPVSCDHFGSSSTGMRDDPNTPEFTGVPAALGNQRDEFGPYAGFWTMPQCPHVESDFVGGVLRSGAPECSVRACLPLAEGDDATCAPWLLVDWK